MWKRQVEGSQHEGTLLSNGLITLRLFARDLGLFCLISFFSFITGFHTSVPRVCSSIFFKRTEEDHKEDRDLFLQ